MRRLSSSPRIAFVDLLFHWPPKGGSWIDGFQVIHGLQARGARVALFCPDFQDFFPRGSIRGELPFEVRALPFNRLSYSAPTGRRRFSRAIEEFAPDLIVILDGGPMKNQLLTALGPERCILRFYAYELLCINQHYYRYHENRICDLGFLDHPAECERCWFRRMPMWGRAAQVLLSPKRHETKLHYSHEYISSLAFTPGYREQLRENLSRVGAAVVYNSTLADKLAPYCAKVEIIPAGVDSDVFHPGANMRRNGPARIFFPGRADDLLKGFEVLLAAGDLLERAGASFEILYTSATDHRATRGWLRNLGWKNQEELADLYREMDIVVAPSIWIEPFGITALEGMATGLPVVASNLGGLARSVLDGETGFLVRPNDPGELAAQMLRLIHDADLRARMGKAGRDRVLAEFTWDSILDFRYVPLVERVLDTLAGKVATMR
ncbi:MAG: D-inositol-3-phosphate glycosyltransferase [bacterium]|nr:D-inositol-3-phosphate glycosyltransferase [bacterium]